jgi:hypothetical protein
MPTRRRRRTPRRAAERVPVQVKHLPALPLKAAPHGEHPPAPVRPHQGALLLEPPAQRLGRERDTIPDVLAQALHRCVGGIGLQVEVLAVDPAHPLALGLPAP